MTIFNKLFINDKQIARIKSEMDIASQMQKYKYPWKSLESSLKEANIKRITLVGYGSLVNINSASRSILQESLQLNYPLVAFGVRRIFNYLIPKKITPYGPVNDQVYRAALNVHVTKNPEDIVNGMGIRITPEDITSLREREKGYDLVPVACIDWLHMQDPPFIAFILSCPSESDIGGKYTSTEILPHPGYYLTCRKGAESIDQEFLELWLYTTFYTTFTTFLADGKTSVLD